MTSPPTVFIAYSRKNSHYARQLETDLRRMGIDAWRDSKIAMSCAKWAKDCDEAIDRCDFFVLLVSPDAESSGEVQREYERATSPSLDKNIILLRVSGEIQRADWNERQVEIHAQSNYAETLMKLLHTIAGDRPNLKSLQSYLKEPNATQLSVIADTLNPPQDQNLQELGLVRLPIKPGGHCMSWLIGPASANSERPQAIGLLFNFTGAYPGTRYLECWKHWQEESCSVGVENPWLIMVEGPIDQAGSDLQYRMRPDAKHEWRDVIELSSLIVGEYGKGVGYFGYYFNALVPIMFEVGLMSTMVSHRRRIYHYDAHQSGTYMAVVDRWA